LSVKLRLMRVGKKKQPTYRIVAADSRSPRDGRFIEIVGTYAPRSDPSGITLQTERALEWLSKGAQPTDTVKKLLEISGVWGEFQASRPVKTEKDRTRPGRARAAKKAPASKAPATKKTAAKKAASKAAAAKKSAGRSTVKPSETAESGPFESGDE
jgi:small subunit ribosomal protein S16